MPTTIKEETALKFEPVHLSDLTKITDLYFSQTEIENQSEHFNQPELTKEFGFPIYKLVKGDLIIGYSYFTVNSSEEIVFNAIINPEYSFGDLESRFINQSKQKYLSKKELDHKGMKNSITRMVDWLNWSS
ncbi:hypothetical protein [Chryseobacterium scophthalmum]|uniref:N-acetyltransferase domain-containing protein n=1 Tax=Chryseobacterium scophthalmum TaxID=59733 RepID=A0A1N6EJZ8_9FLAO|nr:hypothetical protein [Chryseobacterium scophthalmum]SIN83307.1 hypothetical protein SAMN05421769_0449 [Chryseobacterium scophthalmum]